MTEEVKVIDRWATLDQAYDMGYNEFDGMLEAESAEDFDFSHFTQYARWANHILPKLRSMSGFSDRGHGTYTEENNVVLVDEPDDEPADGLLMECHHFHEDVVDEYRRGAYDAALGEGYTSAYEYHNE
jgi:hypothetical protein